MILNQGANIHQTQRGKPSSEGVRLETPLDEGVQSPARHDGRLALMERRQVRQQAGGLTHEGHIGVIEVAKHCRRHLIQEEKTKQRI